MNNLYEERLGTDRMLPLVFRMALPAVAAQIVNLLYSIVDRIYIGHIPGIGTDALAGIGVTSSVIILISAFSSIVGAGGAPLAAIALGQGDRMRAGKILGNGLVLLLLFTVLTSATAYLFMEPMLMAIGASEHTIGYATGLSLGVSARYIVRRGLGGAEHFHQHPGPARHCHVLGHYRCVAEHRSRPAVYFCVRHGCERGSFGYYYLAGMQCLVGGAFPDFAESHFEVGTQVYASRP